MTSRPPTKQPPEEAPEAEESVEVQAHSRKKRSVSAREILPENAEVEEETHELPEEARLCPQCGEVMQPIGKELRETLKIIPAKVILHRDMSINRTVYVEPAKRRLHVYSFDAYQQSIEKLKQEHRSTEAIARRKTNAVLKDGRL